MGTLTAYIYTDTGLHKRRSITILLVQCLYLLVRRLSLPSPYPHFLCVADRGYTGTQVTRLAIALRRGRLREWHGDSGEGIHSVPRYRARDGPWALQWVKSCRPASCARAVPGAAAPSDILNTLWIKLWFSTCILDLYEAELEMRPLWSLQQWCGGAVVVRQWTVILLLSTLELKLATSKQYSIYLNSTIQWVVPATLQLCVSQ